MSLSQQERKEQQALKRLETIEQQLLTVTATALSDEITERLAKTDVVTTSSQRRYAVAYTDAMRFAWLYGHWHVQQLINEAVELAEAPPQMPFKEALSYLESQVPVTSKNYRDLDAHMRLRAFTVASVSSEQAVAQVQGLYREALASGQSSSETMQQVGQFLEQAGVSTANPWYLELHYRNNMMAAYSAGRWAQVENNDLVEYLIYLSVMDSGTTTLCRHLDRTVKPKGDPFWRKYWPPNHHKCRATVSPLGHSQYQRLPEQVKARSAQVSDERVSASPAMASEHQFTSSPTQTLRRLPGSLMSQAQEFKLVSAITAYSKAQSSDLLTERVGALSALSVPSGVVSRAELGKAEQKVAEQLTQSDEVAFGLGQVGDDWQAEVWFFDAVNGGWLWGRALAYDSGNVFAVARITDAERTALLAAAQTLTRE